MKVGMRTRESARMPASPILLSWIKAERGKETVEKQGDDVGKEVVIDEFADEKQAVIAESEIPQIDVLEVHRELRIAVFGELFEAVRCDFES